MIKTEVDEDYVKTLENKLRKLRKDETQLNSKDILNDLKCYREDKLFHLLKRSDHCFEESFIDHPITASYLRRKVAPHTVAVHSGELAVLLESNHTALESFEENEKITSTKAPNLNTVK